MAKRPKRPRDKNQLGKLIVDLATGNAEEGESCEATPVRGRKGGLKGGKARAEKLPPAKRKEIAKRAAEARWKKP